MRDQHYRNLEANQRGYHQDGRSPASLRVVTSATSTRPMTLEIQALAYFPACQNGIPVAYNGNDATGIPQPCPKWAEWNLLVLAASL